MKHKVGKGVHLFFIFASVERWKMERRKIIHIDMDAFYASVEQRDHPEYRGKPVVVGRLSQRGIVAAASYEARKFGIHSAMPAQKARQLCPDLIFIPSRMEVYKAISAEIHTIFHAYTDIVEPLALDEAFLDVTENKSDLQLATDIARKIKEEIREKLGLVASAGISYNKFLAKIASDYRKPDGLYTIHPDKAQMFIDALPIEMFWGIGKVTARKMHSLGIHCGAELRNCSPEMLKRNFGKNGMLYYDFAHGVDLRPVEAERIRKSVGCECTFEKDIGGHTAIIIELYHVTLELIERLRKSDFKGRTLTLKIKFNDFSQRTKSMTVEKPLFTKEALLPLAKKLLHEMDVEEKSIRLLGLSVSHAEESPSSSARSPIQLSFDF